MKKRRILCVAGARPNFVKIAPLVRELRRHSRVLECTLVHTGQHYDPAMSGAFFRDLGIPRPDVNLEIGSGTHAEQVGRTMIEFEKVVRRRRPDWIVVVGDVNATCACAITAAKERIPLAHVEAGLRSFDASMPEEINRLVTDRLADLLFTTDRFADANLRREGVPAAKIRRVGNIMIDTLEHHRKEAARLDPVRIVRDALHTPTHRSLPALCERFAVMTLHRPSNVDDPASLRRLTDCVIDDISPKIPLIWTLHPRTAKQLRKFGLWSRITKAPNVFVVRPLGYLEMLRLNMDARVLLTDSGGLQEECCVLGTPCVTLRTTTERPVTLSKHRGVSVLTGNTIPLIVKAVRRALRQPRHVSRPPLWDGRTAQRIVKAFIEDER